MLSRYCSQLLSCSLHTLSTCHVSLCLYVDYVRLWQNNWHIQVMWDMWISWKHFMSDSLHNSLCIILLKIFAEPPIHSLTSGKIEWNFRFVIFKRILMIDGWGIFCEIVLIWMSLDFADDQSTLVQVMAWCHQATSHYLSQCWPRSLSPYGITRTQWVKTLCAYYSYQ